MKEYIIKYNGDIRATGLNVEILSENYAIITIEEDQVRTLYNYSEIEYIEPAKPLSFVIRDSRDYACITPVQRERGFGLTGRGTIVGIIDSGIDTAHPEFLDDDGKSRVVFLWDMVTEGQPPEGFYMGTEFTKADIDAGMVSDPDPIGHGTSVASIAAGRTGTAPQASIIVVKLGKAYSRSTDVMRGIKYIIDKAQEINMPCAINISYGTNDGSHNGNSLFETYIDSMTDKWKTSIVCAAGNEGYGCHHFFGQLRDNEELIVDFVMGEYSGGVYMTLWKNFVDTTVYRLILPSGRSVDNISIFNSRINVNIDGAEISVLYGQPTHYSVAQNIFFQFNGSTSGVWRLVCYGEDIIDGRFDAWLPTIEDVEKTTMFLHPTPELTMTLPSTAKKVIAVGGYSGSTDTISAFSGRGSTLCDVDVNLDLVAPAEGILTARSGGGYDTMDGTSLAAPFVTGSAALMMEWGIIMGNDPFLYGQRIKAFLRRNAKRSNYLTYPNSIWGYGRLCLYDTMVDLRNHIQR